MLMQAETVTGTVKSASQSTGDSIEHVLYLAGIIILAGALGGLINYFQSIESGAEQPKGLRSSSSMRRRIVIGLGAAFLVPLFLNMISSDLLLACKETPTKLLVFAGFCLVAAISSSAFIRSLSDRLLEQVEQKADEATRQVKEVKSDLEPIKAKATEPKAGASGERQSPSGNVAPPLAVDQAKVLRALCETGFAFRSTEGISETTEIELGVLRVILDGLAQEGFVRQTLTEDGPRWCLTKSGREVDTSTKNSQEAEVVRLRRLDRQVVVDSHGNPRPAADG